MRLLDTYMHMDIPMDMKMHPPNSSSPPRSPPRFLSSPMTSKNFVKWLETGQKPKQTMPGWDQNLEEIQGLTQSWRTCESSNFQ